VKIKLLYNKSRQVQFEHKSTIAVAHRTRCDVNIKQTKSGNEELSGSNYIC